MKILVTGHAGFIGFHLSKKLLERGDTVVGFDLVNDYYDPQLKEARLELLQNTSADLRREYVSIRKDLADQNAVETCFTHHRFDRVIHLAAQGSSQG